MKLILQSRLELLNWVKESTKRWWEKDCFDELKIVQSIMDLPNRPILGEDWSIFLSELNLFQILEDFEKA